jgi:hypothetical protein
MAVAAWTRGGGLNRSRQRQESGAVAAGIRRLVRVYLSFAALIKLEDLKFVVFFAILLVSICEIISPLVWKSRVQSSFRHSITLILSKPNKKWNHSILPFCPNQTQQLNCSITVEWNHEIPFHFIQLPNTPSIVVRYTPYMILCIASGLSRTLEVL